MRFVSTVFLVYFLLVVNSTIPAYAALDIAISEPRLEITTGFTGDTLTLFGTASPKGDIVIVVRGPKNRTTIMKKGSIGGLWIQGDSVSFQKVPGYYNVSSTRPVYQITDMQTRMDNRIGINSLSFQTEDDDIPAEKGNAFLESLIQNMQLKGLYSLTPNTIEFINGTLFKTRIYMPPNVPVGSYTIDAFLFYKGHLIDQKSLPFLIEQGGLAGKIHNFSVDYPFFYGLTVIIIALLSSFLAIILLRRD